MGCKFGTFKTRGNKTSYNSIFQTQFFAPTTHKVVSSYDFSVLKIIEVDVFSSFIFLQIYLVSCFDCLHLSNVIFGVESNNICVKSALDYYQ